MSLLHPYSLPISFPVYTVSSEPPLQEYQRNADTTRMLTPEECWYQKHAGTRKMLTPGACWARERAWNPVERGRCKKSVSRLIHLTPCRAGLILVPLLRPSPLIR